MGIWVGQVLWHVIRKKKKEFFFRDLCSIIWRDKVLAKRCLDIKKNRPDDQIEPVTSRKMELLLSNYFNNSTFRY